MPDTLTGRPVAWTLVATILVPAALACRRVSTERRISYVSALGTPCESPQSRYLVRATLPSCRRTMRPELAMTWLAESRSVTRIASASYAAGRARHTWSSGANSVSRLAVTVADVLSSIVSRAPTMRTASSEVGVPRAPLDDAQPEIATIDRIMVPRIGPPANRAHAPQGRQRGAYSAGSVCVTRVRPVPSARMT